MYVDDLHLHQIPSAPACEAAGITQTTLKNWASRKPPALLLTNEERAEFEKHTRFRFSLRRVYHLAITAELVAFGLGPRRAALIASTFTDQEPGNVLPGQTAYSMGQLCPKGLTLLLARPGQEFGDVVNVSTVTPYFKLKTMGPHRSHGAALIVVNLNEIINRVRGSLGLPPAAVDVHADPAEA